MCRCAMNLVGCLAMLALAGFGGKALGQDQAPTSLDQADQNIKEAMEKSDAEQKVADQNAAAEAEAKAAPKEEPGKKLRFFSAAPGGETGLINVMEAASGGPLTFRLALHGGFFSSSDFLKTDSSWANYSESQQILRAGLAFSPISYLEVFINLRNSTNKNSASQPSLLQTQGDLEIGAKGFYPVIPCLSLGLDFAVNFFNGIGDTSPQFDSTSFRTALLVSFDVRKLAPKVPLRVHLNAGMVFEDSGNLGNNRQLSIIEQYALRVNSYHRVALGFALDGPLPYASPVAITPFLEYTVQIPVGISDADLAKGSLGSATSLSNVLAMKLTPGVRVTWEDLSLDFAVDVGIGGEKAYLDGVPSTPPYTVWIGLAYAFDPFHRAETKIIEKSVEKVVEKQVPAPVTTGRIAGRVVNSADQTPIPGAIVSFAAGGITPVATDEMEGRYSTYDLTAGAVKLTAQHQGFKPATQEAEVKIGEVTLLDFALEPEVKKGLLNGTVANEKDKPMAAKVDITGPTEAHLESNADAGAFGTELPEGSYMVKVSADGYLAKARAVELKENQTFTAEFKLTPAPKQRVVVIEKDKIVLQKKIHFETAKATITADSFYILDSVMDVLANHPEIKKVRIEGHTDSQGSLALNQKLSQARAESVRNYLVQQGFPASRLEAQGYGPDKPIAPNSTERGRELNRRVEFTILEQ